MADWAIVLGASSGFGAATARAFASDGLGILGAHLDLRGTADRAAAVATELEALGVPVVMHNGNAADDRHRQTALDAMRAADPHARVTVLVHSLAFGSLRPFLGAEDARIRERDLAMTSNVMAHSLVAWVQALCDAELLHRGAHVFALTSSGSLVALPSYGAVSAAKAALESHVRQLAVELAPQGIAVNAVMAGLTRTPALQAIPGWEALADRALARNPSGRLTTPDDIAGALVALCDPRMAWMTGQVIRIDGGETVVG